MHISDIEEALDSKSLPRIEAAFRYLVDWPDLDGLDGAEDAQDLSCLLDRVTAALEADTNPMPETLVHSIIASSGDGSWLRDARSYAAGARAVAASSIRWWCLFKKRLGESDETPIGSDPYVTA